MMVSQPGDKRMALIAVLISVPVSALITMGVHTFVKTEPQNVYQITNSVSEGGKHHRGHGKHFAPGKKRGPGKHFGNKEMFRKRFMEFRKARQEMQGKLAGLLKQRIELQEKSKTACPARLLELKSDALITGASFKRGVSRLAAQGGAVSFTAVRMDTAKRIVELDKMAVKAGKVTQDTALANEIKYLQLQLKLTGSRIWHNPEWKKAFADYQQKPCAEALEKMLEAELEAARRTAGRRRK